MCASARRRTHAWSHWKSNHSRVHSRKCWGRVDTEERNQRKYKITSWTMLWAFSVQSGHLLFWKTSRFITHVSGDFLPGPICSVQPHAGATVKNRLMAYSPDAWAASGTCLKHTGGGSNSTMLRLLQNRYSVPAMSAGIWAKIMHNKPT